MNEAEFLASYSPDDFERPSVTVDVALVSVIDEDLSVLMIRRADHPDQDKWQLPGGFVQPDEALDAAARRVLADKAGVRIRYLEQLYTFGDPGRDPRTRVISVAYYALIEADRLPVDSDDSLVATITVPWDGEKGGKVRIHHGKKRLAVAFDHDQMLGMVVKRLRGKLDYSPVGYQVLPPEFTLLQLKQVHETILGESLNNDSFRRRMLNSGELVSTGRKQTDVDHRPATLYSHAGS